MNPSINYFFQEIPGVANDNCKLYFDFLSGNNKNIIYNKSGDINISGLILTGNNQTFFSGFWDYNSSGYFNSDKYIQINNTTGIDIQDFTACFVYKNLKKGGATLISTINTGYIQSYTEDGNLKNNFVYKGFDFGITANNYLYFEYYTDNGPTIFIGNDNLSEKNSIFLSINNNNLLFGHYDFFKENLVSYNYSINTSYLYDANEIFLGYNPKATGTYAFNRKFTGLIDELLIFSPSIYNYEIQNLNSGFVHNFNSGTYYELIENIVTGITGYTSGVIGYENQITGKELIATNEVTGEFGEIYSGYTEYTLSGLFPLSGLIELTGVVSFDFTSGYSGMGVIKNSGYIQTFGKNYINFLNDNTNEDLIELNLTTNYTPNLLKNLYFDYRINGKNFVLKDNLNLNNNYSIYVNGQLHQIGNFYFTGNGYNSGKYIINDYIIENSVLYFGNSYDENDYIVSDYLISYNTGLYIDNFIVNSGVGFYILTGWTGALYNIYFNGQKLVSGLHYNLDSSGYIQFNKNSYIYTGVSGKLIGVNKLSDLTITGSGNFFNTNLYNFSEIYKNGVRQLLNNDYLELASIDSNTGKGFFDQKSDIIYNNNDNII